MSMQACLAHEIAHYDRYMLNYKRTAEMPDVLLDEAETSIRASFELILSRVDREFLVADARDRLVHWLSIKK